MTFFTADRRRVNVYPGQGPDSRSTFSHAVSSVCKNLLRLAGPTSALRQSACPRLQQMRRGRHLLDTQPPNP